MLLGELLVNFYKKLSIVVWIIKEGRVVIWMLILVVFLFGEVYDEKYVWNLVWGD